MFTSVRVSTDGIGPSNLIIDYVEDKVAADATYAVNRVANGISIPDATQPFASPVANLLLSSLLRL